MQAIKVRPRPVDPGLLRARLPIGAVVSIVHRITGVALVVMFPVALYLLADSLSSPHTFSALQAAVARPGGRALAGAATWPLAHHFYAGIRHLLLDLDIGADLKSARLSAALALGAGLGTALIVAVIL